jgi:hypothetical protein
MCWRHVGKRGAALAVLALVAAARAQDLAVYEPLQADELILAKSRKALVETDRLTPGWLTRHIRIESGVITSEQRGELAFWAKGSFRTTETLSLERRNDACVRVLTSTVTAEKYRRVALTYNIGIRLEQPGAQQNKAQTEISKLKLLRRDITLLQLRRVDKLPKSKMEGWSSDTILAYLSQVANVTLKVAPGVSDLMTIASFGSMLHDAHVDLQSLNGMGLLVEEVLKESRAPLTSVDGLDDTSLGRQVVTKQETVTVVPCSSNAVFNSLENGSRHIESNQERVATPAESMRMQDPLASWRGRWSTSLGEIEITGAGAALEITPVLNRFVARGRGVTFSVGHATGERIEGKFAIEITEEQGTFEIYRDPGHPDSFRGKIETNSPQGTETRVYTGGKVY